MNLYTVLITNTFPLILLIGLGYIAGRFFKVSTKTMADIAIYIITPVVVFGAVARLDFRIDYLLLPAALFVVAAAITLTAYMLTSRFMKGDRRGNLISMAAGTANTGYFGLPIILALLGPDQAGLYLIMMFAMTLNESTFAYYAGARGEYSIRDSLMKVAHLPMLYAMLAGLAVNALGITLPDIFNVYWEKFAGAWTIIGMMIIGVALASNKWQLHWPLLAGVSAIRFIVWPAIMLALIALDRHVLHLFGPDVYTMLLVIGSVPLAGNLTAFATQLNVNPGEAAVATLLTSIFAIVYIPLVLTAFGG